MNSTRKTFALLSTSALAAGAARGAILYTPVNITLSQNGVLALDLNQDGLPDFDLAFKGGAAKPYIASAANGVTSDYVLAGGNLGLPLTAAGMVIDGTYQSLQTTGYFNQDDNGNVVGGWSAAGNVEGYVGLELVDGAGTHYGWAHLVYNAAGAPPNNVDTGTLTLVDVAMETDSAVGIVAGQTADAGQPAMVVSPSSQAGYLGGSAKLAVIATGSPAPGYQWRAGAVASGSYTNLPNGTGVTVGTMNTLTLHNLQSANTADYVVVVSNANGSVTSSVPATLTVLAATDSPATLVHRYSFQDLAGSPTFADSVGGPAWNGTPQGSAALTGSALQLDGSAGCYASLPANITSNYNQMTVEFWADIGAGNPAWTRVFSFGDAAGGQKSSGVDFCPLAPGIYQNLDLTSGGTNSYANNNTTLVGSNNVHIAVVVDSVNAAMYYYDGPTLVSTLHNAVSSLATISDPLNWIGASLASADPYLAGTIHEFRIYQGVLSAQAIALNDAMGPVNYIQLSANPTLNALKSGSNLVLSWPGSDYNFAVQARTNLSNGAWVTLTNKPAVVGTNWQVSLPLSGAARFFQLVQ